MRLAGAQFEKGLKGVVFGNAGVQSQPWAPWEAGAAYQTEGFPVDEQRGKLAGKPEADAGAPVLRTALLG
ncbi:hypothetical protein [Mesorhizobium sp. M0185]|uniref:hypothetical protein n=1 Tax=Mesorhizobium sp. M0185 TaxID=2956907 RepID=UPI00333D8174